MRPDGTGGPALMRVILIVADERRLCQPAQIRDKDTVRVDK